jgi:hypothetical protein
VEVEVEGCPGIDILTGTVRVGNITWHTSLGHLHYICTSNNKSILIYRDITATIRYAKENEQAVSEVYLILGLGLNLGVDLVWI